MGQTMNDFVAAGFADTEHGLELVVTRLEKGWLGWMKQNERIVGSAVVDMIGEGAAAVSDADRSLIPVQSSFIL